MTNATRLPNKLDSSGVLLEDVKPDTRIHLWKAIDGESFFIVTSQAYCDEDNDNLVTIEVTDSQGRAHCYTTGELGLTCNRYGVWENVAWTY